MKNRTTRLAALALLVAVHASLAGAQAPTRIFAENFDTLTLSPNLDEGFADPNAFTHTPPSGWAIDNSELNAEIPTLDPRHPKPVWRPRVAGLVVR